MIQRARLNLPLWTSLCPDIFDSLSSLFGWRDAASVGINERRETWLSGFQQRKQSAPVRRRPGGDELITAGEVK